MQDINLHIPHGTLLAYKDAPVWQDFILIEDLTALIETEIRELKFYPNPVKDKLTIDSGELIIDSETVEIYDISEHKIVNAQWFDGKSVNVSHLPSGVYILKIGEWRRRFVRE